MYTGRQIVYRQNEPPEGQPAWPHVIYTIWFKMFYNLDLKLVYHGRSILTLAE